MVGRVTNSSYDLPTWHQGKSSRFLIFVQQYTKKGSPCPAMVLNFAPICGIIIIIAA